jgi:hypothetical protein
MHREHNDFGLESECRDTPHGSHAAESRHGDIHDRHVGPTFPDLLDCIFSGGGFPDDLQTLFRSEQNAQPGAQHRVIVIPNSPTAAPCV